MSKIYHFPTFIIMSEFAKYLRLTMAELRQVSWPSRRQTIMYTVLVIGLTTVVALYVGSLDYLFSRGIDFLVNYHR
jgi:preprotein translocase subunit SecE